MHEKEIHVINIMRVAEIIFMTCCSATSEMLVYLRMQI